MRIWGTKDYIKIGIAFEQSGDIPNAIYNIQRGLELKPNQPDDIYAALGNLFLKSGKDEEAGTVYQKLIDRNPDSPHGYAGLALVAQNKQDWETALKYWDACLAKNKAKVASWWLVKKANALLEAERYTEAEELFIEILDKHTDQLWALVGLAQIAQKLGDTNIEIQRLEALLGKFPDHDAGRLRYGILLRESGRFEEAEACFQYLKTNKPEAKDVLEALAWTARAARQYDLAVERWEELCKRFPKIVLYKKLYIQSLLDTLAFDQAQEYYNRHLSAQSSIDYQMLQADIYWRQLEVEKALEVVDKILSIHPEKTSIVNKKVGYLLMLFRSSGNQVFANQALEVLEGLGGRNSTDQDVLNKIISIYILLDKKDDALQLIAQMPDSQNQFTMELKAWACHIEGNDDQTQKIWQDIQNRHIIPQIQTPDPETLKRTDTNPVKTSRESIMVYTVVRNERWRLPWFLEYYRSLGVDRFFFVDNDSTDGTADYLHKQKDVHVFWTNQSYAKAYSGMQWVNGLVEQYGSDGWCLYVDVDEALIFPGIEKRSLRGLTRYLADKGQEAMYAFMLDMYAPGLQSQAKEENYSGFMEDYPLFDNQYFWINSIYCPYKYTAGGIRRRFRLFENQTKTPIIRGGRGIKFLMSSHQITPAKLSDVTGVLLHYKLAGDFEREFARDLVVNTRMPNCKRRHWGYIQALQNLTPEDSLEGEHAVSYQSSQQLVDLGLIKTSSDFEAAKYD